MVKLLSTKQTKAPSGSAESALHPHLAKQLKELDLVVYTTDSCHYCKLYKQFIYRNGLRPYIKLVDINNKEDTSNDDFLRTNQLSAYPFTYSKAMRTSFPGLPKDVNEIIVFLTTQNN
jgi:glutaredoxin